MFFVLVTWAFKISSIILALIMNFDNVIIDLLRNDVRKQASKQARFSTSAPINNNQVGTAHLIKTIWRRVDEIEDESRKDFKKLLGA